MDQGEKEGSGLPADEWKRGSVIYGLLASKGAPKEVIEIIYPPAKKVVENHEAFVAERLDKLGAWFEGPEEYSAQLSRQNELRGSGVMGSGVRPAILHIQPINFIVALYRRGRVW